MAKAYKLTQGRKNTVIKALRRAWMNIAPSVLDGGDLSEQGARDWACAALATDPTLRDEAAEGIIEKLDSEQHRAVLEEAFPNGTYNLRNQRRKYFRARSMFDVRAEMKEARAALGGGEAVGATRIIRSVGFAEERAAKARLVALEAEARQMA